MGDNTGRKAHAVYDYFTLESEQTKYKLHLGVYNGTAGDGMRACGSTGNNDDMPFSTPGPNNNDNWPINCAHSNRAGWWYKGCWCSKLNRPYDSNA